MTTMWSTSRPRGWPVNGFQARFGAIVLGIGAMLTTWYLQPKYEWDAMQRHYLTHYILTSIGGAEKVGHFGAH